MIAYYFVGILFAFLQNIWAVVLWQVIVIGVASWRGKPLLRIYFLAFLLGLLTDLISGGLLGGTSIFLLLVVASFEFCRNLWGANWRIILLLLVLWEIIYRLWPLVKI